MTIVNSWLNQRISSIPLIFLGGWLIWEFCKHGNDHYENTLIWFSNVWTIIGLFLFILIANYHAFLGLKVVIEDYILSTKQYRYLFILRVLVITIPAITLLLLIKIYFLVNQ